MRILATNPWTGKARRALFGSCWRIVSTCQASSDGQRFEVKSMAIALRSEPARTTMVMVVYTLRSVLRFVG